MGSIYRFDTFVLDPAGRKLLKNDRPVGLSGKPFDVLVLLVTAAGELVGQDAIREAMWGSAEALGSESDLRKAILEVRRALGDSPPYRYIENVRGHGYRFCAAVVVEAAPATGVNATTSREAPAVAEQSPRRPLAPGLFAMSLALLGAALGAALTWLALREPSNEPTSASQFKLNAERVGIEVVLVRSGKFVMYSSSEDIERARELTEPTLREESKWRLKHEGRHGGRKTLEEPNNFYMFKYPTTHLQLHHFLEEHPEYYERAHQIHKENMAGQGKPRDYLESYPAYRVDWYLADAFCRSLGGRLPSERQYEKAARDHQPQMFVWGDEVDLRATNHGAAALRDEPVPGLYDHVQKTDPSDGHAGVAPNGRYSRDVSVWDVVDLAGNVAEWTDDWASSHRVSKVIKGCSWKRPFADCRIAARADARLDGQDDDLGFRCVGFDGPKHWQ